MFLGALDRYKLQLLGTFFSVLIHPVFSSKFKSDVSIIDAGEVPVII